MSGNKQWWEGWAESLDTFADIVWPTTIAVVALAVAAYAAGSYGRDALLATFSL